MSAADILRERAEAEPGSRQAHEALALADLLDAVWALDEAWRKTTGDGNAVVPLKALGEVLERRDALEAAIDRSGT